MSVYRVDGMTCGGCAAALARAIRMLAPQAAVTVDVAGGLVTVDHATAALVERAVISAGFGWRGTATQPLP